MHFTCACGAQLEAPDEFAGRQAVCPTCGATIDVPATPEPLPILDLANARQEPPVICAPRADTSATQAYEAARHAVFSVLHENGMGSAFLVHETGIVVTNAHVLGRAAAVALAFEDGTRHVATAVSARPDLDLAFLAVPPSSLRDQPPLSLAREDPPVGTPVFAIGNPLGLSHSLSRGIVSAVNRKIEGLKLIQTDAPINPGNSGGPLLDVTGQVVGMVTMGAALADGLNFAIPSTVIAEELAKVVGAGPGATPGIYCSVCGTSSTSRDYCSNCGASLRTAGSKPFPDLPVIPEPAMQQASVPAAAMPWNCRACGTFVADGAAYCPTCGSSNR